MRIQGVNLFILSQASPLLASPWGGHNLSSLGGG